MATLASLVVKIGADISDFRKKLQDSTKTLKSASDKMASVGRSLTTGLTLPLVGVGAAAIKSSVDFNSAMANVATLIPGNTARVNQLKQAVQDMAVQTGKSTSDLADGLYQVISAFGDSADTAKILEINAKAAAAGLATTDDAIKLTSAVTKGYGDTSAQAVQHVSDLAFETVKLGQTTFPELASAIGQAVPLAKQLGIGMNELFASEATLTGVTGDTSEVTTGLRAAMQALMSPTTQMQAALKSLGFDSGAAAIKALGFKGTLDKLVQSAHGNTAQLSKMFGQVEGLTQVLALTGSQSDNFTKKLAAMQQAAGATNQAFNEQTKGINQAGFSFAQLKEKVQVAAQKLGDGLAPALNGVLTSLSPVINFVTRLATGFSHLNPHTQQFIVIIGLLLTLLGPLLVMVSTFMSTVTALAGAMDVALGPMFLIVGAIMAMIAVVALVVAYWKPLSGFFVNLWNGIKSAIVSIVSAIGIWLSSAWNSIIGGVTSAWNHVKSFISSVWNAIAGFFKKWWPTLLLVFLPGVGYIIDLVVQHWNQIKVFTSQIWNSVTTFLSGVWNRIASVASSIWGHIRIVATSIWNGIYNAIHGPVSRAENALSGIWTGIRNRAVGAWNSLRSSATSIFTAIRNAITAPFRNIHIPLPHMSFTTSTKHFAGISFPVPIPHISWYAKGGLFDGPSVIGVGESGAEAVIPLTGSRMRPFAQAIAAEMGGAGAGGEIHVHVYLDSREISQHTVSSTDTLMERRRQNRSRALGER